jgi:predicted ester cyclase
VSSFRSDLASSEGQQAIGNRGIGRSLSIDHDRSVVADSRDERIGAGMDMAERELQVRRFVEDVWNGRNYEAAADLYGESHVNPFGTGPSARVEPIRRYHQAFSDMHLDVDELIAAGDTVWLRWTFRGTDTGGHLGRPPTGRAVEGWVVDIMHFEGDRVVTEWIGADNLGVFMQLGVVDDPWPTQIETPTVKQ